MGSEYVQETIMATAKFLMGFTHITKRRFVGWVDELDEDTAVDRMRRPTRRLKHGLVYFRQGGAISRLTKKEKRLLQKKVCSTLRYDPDDTEVAFLK